MAVSGEVPAARRREVRMERGINRLPKKESVR